MAAESGQRSLFGEILDWMLAPLLVIWPISVALTWLVAQGIASKPYDRELGETARSLGLQIASEQRSGQARSRYALSSEAAALLRADESDTVYYLVLNPRGEFLSGDRGLPPPPAEEGIVPWELRFRDDEVGNESVRVAYLWVTPEGSSGTMLVQVAETLGKRSRLTNEIIKGVILPQFVILPLAVLLVWLALARGIAPLNDLQRRIRSRDSSDLSPIDERRIPDEVAPLVRAINDLLQRLDQSISSQRHFLADAAHQLKTPLAGLRTQAEFAQREIDEGRSTPTELKRSLQQIALSSQRAAHMVNQLLAMARAEDQEHAARRVAVNLPELAMETVRDFVPRAFEKRLDLGYEGPDEDSSALRIHGHPLLIRELIRNLVDNALLYTPPGGTITVRVVEDPFGQVCVLQVEDSGPGIAEAEREKVFQPFYRALGTNVDGSGLGLAIVREIAQQHDAELSLDDARPRRPGFVEPDGMGPGARFTVRFHA
ncbi:sensor histidine kinase N-terminal domain-containing protein [Paucibacter sp. APW11]|uniref:histidine kinase n=1 Tax=Roseateles aquae TaxID=3077235 RepID=A0ABU3PEQ0_9BURK|nr:sensor histidine kinase N-terminal domain-containing protein [Paucibacter sp. APW11]MDT9001019.1 sensor histidine kinase N-terminal domain-containing protein [Paucibacter sp. APW11]